MAEEALVINSLRSQVQDLFTQVSQLNSKLVKSYDRVSDLEDELHVSSNTLRSNSIKISQLELERTQHASALNTGLLVERAHVTAELTKLMEKATEEAAHRGQAESARADIEKELDDLSASLFSQANSMVAEARFSASQSARRAEESEQALQAAEDAVRLMQKQTQDLQLSKEQAEQTAERLRRVVGKDRWVDESSTKRDVGLHLISTHVPYEEFLLFVAHLRAVHLSTPNQPTPAISSFLHLPFLVRILAEDSEPTIRLDFAPSLNWLSRRAVLSAIYAGQLTIEPIYQSTIESPISTITSSSLGCVCALCGRALVPGAQNKLSGWASAFKTPRLGSASPSTPTQLNDGQQTFVFRLSSGATPASLPSAYPLCATGWCLSRLRSVCSLWNFIRIGILEHVWGEEVPVSLQHLPQPSLASQAQSHLQALLPPPTRVDRQTDSKPPIPPRKRSLWGMASVLSERAASWKGSKVGENEPPPVPLRHPRDVTPPPLPKRSDSRGRPSETESDFGLKNSQEAAAQDVPSSKLNKSSDSAETKGENFSTPPEQVLRRLQLEDENVLSVGQIPASDLSVPNCDPGADNSKPQQVSGVGSTKAVDTLLSTNVNLDDHESDQHSLTSLLKAAIPLEIANNAPLSTPPSTPPPSIRPHDVPLPESRPSTPVRPPRMSSPAHTPPPLPRRAAGRVSRPMSVAISSADIAGLSTVDERRSIDVSRPFEGDPFAEARQVQARSSIESRGTQKENRTETAHGIEKDALSALPRKMEEPVEPTPAPDQDGIGNTKPGDTLSLDNKGAEENVCETSHPPEVTRNAPPTLPSRRNRAEIVSHLTVAESVPPSIPPYSEADSNQSDNLNDGQHKQTILKESPEASSAERESLGRLFIGEATWEERSWKELVRLREEMFMARVGCIQL